MRKIIILVFACLLAAVLFNCQEKVSPLEEGGSVVHLKVISPTTGKVTLEKDVPLNGDTENNLRQAIGMPTREEEAKVATYLTKGQVLQLEVLNCVYIKKYGSSAFFDPEATMWTGVNYHGSFIPALEYFPTGTVKSVVRDIPVPSVFGDAPGGNGFFASKNSYRIVYFFEENIASNKHETEWYQRNQGRYKFEAEVPELCPLPPD